MAISTKYREIHLLAVPPQADWAPGERHYVAANGEYLVVGVPTYRGGRGMVYRVTRLVDDTRVTSPAGVTSFTAAVMAVDADFESRGGAR